MGLLDGQTVLITGAAGGIGRAMVEAFNAAGARIIACDRARDLLETVAAEQKHGFDLTDPDACRAALEAVAAAVGTPDIVVSNAGYTRADTLEQVDDAAWATELASNLTAARNITAPLLPAMKARGRGTFVFVSSVNGLAHFGNPAYAAAKAGLIAYARAIATECGAAGIRANTVCPGTVRTPIWARRIASNPEILERLTRLYPLGRIVEPSEVAQVAVFLAGPMASAVTGVTLPVDAGLMAGNLPFIHEIA
jgi:NAD(P)-dependent dehydrogenase (short-subunit alcohol dehydrogenase family)